MCTSDARIWEYLRIYDLGYTQTHAIDRNILRLASLQWFIRYINIDREILSNILNVFILRNACTFTVKILLSENWKRVSITIHRLYIAWS